MKDRPWNFVSAVRNTSPLVHSVTTKTDTITKWGLEGTRMIRQLTQQPLVAIGNIHPENTAKCISAAANCLAVVCTICSADNPEKAAA